MIVKKARKSMWRHLDLYRKGEKDHIYKICAGTGQWFLSAGSRMVKAWVYGDQKMPGIIDFVLLCALTVGLLKFPGEAVLALLTPVM